MCVGPCVYQSMCASRFSQTRSGRTFGRRTFVLRSFERSIPLVLGGVTALWCHVTLTNLLIAEVTHSTKFAFSLFFNLEKTIQDIEITWINH